MLELMGFLRTSPRDAAAAMADVALDLVRQEPPAPPAEIEALLERVVDRLAGRFPHAEHEKLKSAALAAWAQVEGERTRCHVDLAKSTPYLLVLVDQISRRQRTVPVADLVRILGPRIPG